MRGQLTTCNLVVLTCTLYLQVNLPLISIFPLSHQYLAIYSSTCTLTPSLACTLSPRCECWEGWRGEQCELCGGKVTCREDSISAPVLLYLGTEVEIPVPAPEPSALLHPSVQVKMTDTGGQSWLAEAAGNYTTNMKCTWYVLCRVPVPWPNCTYTWFYTRSVHLPEEVVWQEI